MEKQSRNIERNEIYCEHLNGSDSATVLSGPSCHLCPKSPTALPWPDSHHSISFFIDYFLSLLILTHKALLTISVSGGLDFHQDDPLMV